MLYIANGIFILSGFLFVITVFAAIVLLLSSKRSKKKDTWIIRLITTTQCLIGLHLVIGVMTMIIRANSG